jgi:uncharacterized protein YbjT (DUF2867 family)
MTSGLDGEIRQGRNVGEAAHRAGVQHLVQGSAGTGERGTGVGSFEAKLDIEERLTELGLPVTVLRPMAFMELMTDRAFFPPAGIWHVWPKISGWDLRVPWLSCHDLGRIAERVFARPEDFLGRQLCLAAEVRSLEECRRIYARVVGRRPRRFPMPVWLFERFAPDTAALWRWLPTAHLDVDPALTRSILPDPLTVEDWLAQQFTGSRGSRVRR